MAEPAKRSLMLVENRYPNDIRVRKEAEALTEAGYTVMVISLKGRDQKYYEEINRVRNYRIPEINIFEKTKQENANFVVKLLGKIKSILGYMLEYIYFTLASFLVSLYILVRHGFDVVHMHNPPDTLSLTGIFYKFLGKKYVFDHHDLSPELYLTRVSGKKDLIYRGLLFFERLSCRFSDVIISTNESYRQIEIDRHSVNPRKIFIVRNNPILDDCVLSGAGGNGSFKQANGKITLLFLGSINPQDGVDALLKALHHLVHELGERNIICNIVGGGDSLEPAKRIAAELGLTDYVDFRGRIYDREKIKEYLWHADIGVEPAPCNTANEHSTFIKVMEFMAAGKPVVAFDLKETRYSAGEAALLAQPGDIKGYAVALQQLINNPVESQNMGQAGFKRIKENLNWQSAAENLRNAYKSLV